MLKKEGFRKIKTIWQCDTCGKDFEVNNNRAREAHKKGHKKFCSKDCRLQHQKTESSKRVINWVKKNGSSSFKYGMGITTDGYIWLLIKGHGYYHNQIKLHRYLMQIKLNRKLLSNEIVHHINGNKYDNRIENLEILTKSKHNQAHRFFLDNRKDIWNDKEIECLYSDLSAKSIHSLYPARSIDAIYQKRHKLSMVAQGVKIPSR